MQALKILVIGVLALGLVSALPVTQEEPASATSVVPTAVIVERQEEAAATEISTGPQEPNAEDDSDEASSETVTEAPAAVTEIPKQQYKVPLNSTFNNEWNIVTSPEIQNDDADDEDNEVTKTGVKKPETQEKFVDEKTSTFEQEWAYVNGNASAITKPPKKTTEAPKVPVVEAVADSVAAGSTAEPVVSTASTTTTTARTFQHEWDVVVGNEKNDNKVQEQEPIKASTSKTVVEAATTEVPEGVNEEEEEEDEESATAAPVVAITSSTKKPFVVGSIGDASFQKEWAVVTGEAVNAQKTGEYVQGSDNATASKARADCGNKAC